MEKRVLYRVASLNASLCDLHMLRRELSLTQYYDDIAGNAKDSAVEDYACRLNHAIDSTYNFILRNSVEKIYSKL